MAKLTAVKTKPRRAAKVGVVDQMKVLVTMLQGSSTKADRTKYFTGLARRMPEQNLKTALEGLMSVRDEAERLRLLFEHEIENIKSVPKKPHLRVVK